jgi:hypothetical protein
MISPEGFASILDTLCSDLDLENEIIASALVRKAAAILGQNPTDDRAVQLIGFAREIERSSPTFSRD